MRDTEPREFDFKIVGMIPLPAFTAMANALAEIYPDARVSMGTGYLGITLGDRRPDENPEPEPRETQVDALVERADDVGVPTSRHVGGFRTW